MKPLLFILNCIMSLFIYAQPSQGNPCTTDSSYRQFDFWIGDWEVFGKTGKAGDSKIELILDSCVILENWTSSTPGYRGKSFNTYNAGTKQWQQTWVDNRGGSTEFLRGEGQKDKITFWADQVKSPNGKSFDRRLTFYKISNDKVRQHGERSDDAGKTWSTEYDLEYRRK